MQLLTTNSSKSQNQKIIKNIPSESRKEDRQQDTKFNERLQELPIE